MGPTEVNAYYGELKNVIGKYKFRVCDIRSVCKRFDV